MRILVKSIFDTFEYVMDHYYPFGMADFAGRNDSYAIISIQDSHTEGFGLTFTPNYACKDVLTLIVDDIIKPVDGAILFDDSHARQIIDFIEQNRNRVDTLLIHYYAGQSRSTAVGAFAMEYLGQDNTEFIKHHTPNQHILETLRQTKTRP